MFRLRTATVARPTGVRPIKKGRMPFTLLPPPVMGWTTCSPGIRPTSQTQSSGLESSGRAAPWNTNHRCSAHGMSLWQEVKEALTDEKEKQTPWVDQIVAE